MVTRTRPESRLSGSHQNKRSVMATLGLSDKKTKKNAKSNSQADEAADILKKMEEKKDAGDCPFC